MQKMGPLEQADQGTLFLDEVGDIPIEIQTKLLRASQDGNSSAFAAPTRKVNVRLVAATHRDPEKLIAEREFRSDLAQGRYSFAGALLRTKTGEKNAEEHGSDSSCGNKGAGHLGLAVGICGFTVKISAAKY